MSYRPYLAHGPIVEHSDQCPPVDPFSTKSLSCWVCNGVRADPYEDRGPVAACPCCGRTDVPTSSHPAFAGYLGPHDRPGSKYQPCAGVYRVHGQPAAARTGTPRWIPLGHVRAGDVIRRPPEWHGTPQANHQVLYTLPRPGRVLLRWRENEARNPGSWSGRPGLPVLLVEPADGPRPRGHVRVWFINAINGRTGFTQCYPSVRDAFQLAPEVRPFNNTRSAMTQCWRTGCLR